MTSVLDLKAYGLRKHVETKKQQRMAKENAAATVRSLRSNQLSYARTESLLSMVYFGWSLYELSGGGGRGVFKVFLWSHPQDCSLTDRLCSANVLKCWRDIVQF